MLEHQKLVLKGVDNNRQLFKKELSKSLNWLNSDELDKLKSWVLENYFNRYNEIINDVFRTANVA
ncbi:MAG: hypothetical protein GXO79_16540 [Chlorobi bacterium]|nr:hypothetical protein [Chlorobiota bacterium]